MNEPRDSAEFLSSLLAQDPLVKSTDFTQNRVRVLQRMARARRRERLARWASLAFAGIALAGLALLAATNLDLFGHSDTWPEWAKNAAATAFFLLPVPVLLLGGIYFVRHRRELQAARLAAYQHALSELEREIGELKARQPPPQASPSAEKPPRPGGFTLLELLMSMAIVLVLSGLVLLPAARAKTRARTAVCQSQLNQLGRALAIYVSEFHRYPGTITNPVRPSSNPGPKRADPDNLLWDDRLQPYLGDRSVLACPARALSAYERAYGENPQANYSYGYNALGSGLGDPPQNLGLGRAVLLGGSPGVGLNTTLLAVNEEQVVAPADLIALADRAGGEEFCTPVVAPGKPSVRISEDPSDRHAGGGNAVFCDGHLEFARQAQWKEASEGARRRWNNDHQPHAETW